jgi:hypothetical protein
MVAMALATIMIAPKIRYRTKRTMLRSIERVQEKYTDIEKAIIM